MSNGPARRVPRLTVGSPVTSGQPSPRGPAVDPEVTVEVDEGAATPVDRSPVVPDERVPLPPPLQAGTAVTTTAMATGMRHRAALAPMSDRDPPKDKRDPPHPSNATHEARPTPCLVLHQRHGRPDHNHRTDDLAAWASGLEPRRHPEGGWCAETMARHASRPPDPRAGIPPAAVSRDRDPVPAASGRALRVPLGAFRRAVVPPPRRAAAPEPGRNGSAFAGGRGRPGERPGGGPARMHRCPAGTGSLPPHWVSRRSW